MYFLKVISNVSKGARSIERNVLGMFNFLCSYIDPCMPVSGKLCREDENKLYIIGTCVHCLRTVQDSAPCGGLLYYYVLCNKGWASQQSQSTGLL